MSQFNRRANWQNNPSSRESNRSVFRMVSGNGSNQWETPGIPLVPVEESARSYNNIGDPSIGQMGMNISSPISSFPVGGGGQRFPGRLLGSTILLDQMTTPNTNIVSPTPTTEAGVVEIHSTGEHEVNSGGASHENQTDEGVEVEEEEQVGVGDMRRLPYKRRSDHPLAIGESSRSRSINTGEVGVGVGVPRRRVEGNTNTSALIPGPVNIGAVAVAGPISVVPQTQNFQSVAANNDPRPQATFVPSAYMRYDHPQHHVPFPNQPPLLVYSMVPPEHVPLFLHVQQGHPWSSSVLRPFNSPTVTIPAATARGLGTEPMSPFHNPRNLPNPLRPHPPPHYFGMGLGNNSNPNPSFHIPTPNYNSSGWFRRANVDEQYMMIPTAADPNHTFYTALTPRQTSSALSPLNNNIPSGWWNLIAQNQRNRQLRDETKGKRLPYPKVRNALDHMRDSGLMQLEILVALENELGFVENGLTEQEIMSHIGQEIFQSAADQDTSENEICSVCQEEYVNGEQLGRLDCGHKYHLACIKQWLVLRNICPICKQTALAIENDE